MFDLIEGAAGLPGDLSETNPHQYGAGDVIALDARFAALAALDAGQLFGLAMKLLDLPAQAARVLCGLRRILSEVVGDDPVRAVCRHLNPEQLHLVKFGKAFDLDGFAMRESARIPLQRIDAPVWGFCAGVVHLPVGAQRAVVDLLQRLDCYVPLNLGSSGGVYLGIK